MIFISWFIFVIIHKNSWLSVNYLTLSFDGIPHEDNKERAKALWLNTLYFLQGLIDLLSKSSPVSPKLITFKSFVSHCFVNTIERPVLLRPNDKHHYDKKLSNARQDVVKHDNSSIITITIIMALPRNQVLAL